eukprot:CAMPEP_0202976450 /NCGR_PEP_ID=MMETSP1396-20130829/77452_1 /ASSEMBLY_ACC=CAM_ASM_000872 /TAXON_ID= /ORGANISM="Pseudokeronopsis sp., Strain Brazil" /LENGTH=78 /DNA_ID=CAMNT_0049713763 /DNA_START=22 /DNA_END=255 /DNA_ORIENTATION=-
MPTRNIVAHFPCNCRDRSACKEDYQHHQSAFEFEVVLHLELIVRQRRSTSIAAHPAADEDEEGEEDEECDVEGGEIHV